MPTDIRFTIGSNRYVADGVTQTVDTAPFIADGRTYLPLRDMGYAIGMSDADIAWDPTSRTATFTFSGHEVLFTLGSRTYTVEGDELSMDVAPVDRDGRIFLPAAYFGRAFGYGVQWDARDRQVILTASSETPNQFATVSSGTSSAVVAAERPRWPKWRPV